MVRTGFRLVMGSWKIMAISLPRNSRISDSSSDEQVLPVEDDLAALDPARRRRQEPHDGQVRDGLAAARFADEPERLALVEIEGDAVDGEDALVMSSEANEEVVDGEEVHRRLPLQSRVEGLAQAVAQEVEADGADHDRGARGRGSGKARSEGSAPSR